MCSPSSRSRPFFPCAKVLRVALFASLLPVAHLRADEQTRQMQEELRRRHLFYSDIDGRYSPDLSTAVRRYQERQGFPATGIPDEVTLRSLGVSGPAAPAELPDEPVLRSDSGLNALERQASGTPPAPTPPAKPVRPSRASRKEIADFIRHYLDACQSPNLDDELAFYSTRVDYFDSIMVDKGYIRNELAAYDQHWPTRKYKRGDSLNIRQFGDRIVARCRISFTVANPARAQHASGRTDDTFILSRRADGKLEIASIQEQRVTSQPRGRNSMLRNNPVTGAVHKVHSVLKRIFRKSR